MTPTATDDLPADLVERVNALSQRGKGQLLDLLLDGEDEISNQPMQWASEKVRLAWKEEIARRIATYMSGEVKGIPAEEALAMLDAELAQLAAERSHAG
jgi:Putative addiction module component